MQLTANNQHTETLKFAEQAINEGDLEKAEMLYSQILLLNINSPEALFGMGLVYMRKMDWRSAIEIFTDLSNMHKDNAAIFINLSKSLEMTGEINKAITAQEKAAEILHDDAMMQVILGHLYSQAGLSEKAVDAYKAAIKIDPSCKDAYQRLGANLELHHKLEEMEELIKEAKKNIPDSHACAFLEARFERRNNNIEKGISILEKLDLSNDDKSVDIHFELGQLYDRAGKPEKAFKHFEKANDIQANLEHTKTIPINSYTKLISSMTEALSKEGNDYYKSRKKTAYNGLSPVFIVGFPRSGTTLLNKILSSHPSIYGIEEIPAIGTIATKEIERHGNSVLSFMHEIPKFSESKLKEMRHTYFEIHNQSSAGNKGRIIIDKLPLNIVNLPLINAMFPDSKIILALRHPYDCVLSCFMQKFAINHAMINFLNIESSAKLYADVMELYKLCNKKLPIDVHTIKYEDVVADLKGEISKTIEFIGAEWDDCVLDYKDKKQIINTPSYAQITEDIYDRAKYRWTRYREQIEPVIDILSPYAEYFKYDVA
jgi:tetratricopeptide (TPR) repeat protein